jgi:hypothetical protein
VKSSSNNSPGRIRLLCGAPCPPGLPFFNALPTLIAGAFPTPRIYTDARPLTSSAVATTHRGRSARPLRFYVASFLYAYWPSRANEFALLLGPCFTDLRSPFFPPAVGRVASSSLIRVSFRRWTICPRSPEIITTSTSRRSAQLLLRLALSQQLSLRPLVHLFLVAIRAACFSPIFITIRLLLHCRVPRLNLFFPIVRITATLRKVHRQFLSRPRPT